MAPFERELIRLAGVKDTRQQDMVTGLNKRKHFISVVKGDGYLLIYLPQYI